MPTLGIACVVAAHALVAATAGSPPPNIILFVIDDLGFADLSLIGAGNRTANGQALDYQTKNIDKLAREGIMLNAYYVNRLCSPTRTSLLSSRYAYNLGLAGGVITNGFPVALRLNESTIANFLKKEGYQTHGFGKWDIGYHTWEHTPTYRGFDTWLGYYNADEDYFTHSCGGGGCKGGKMGDLRNGTNALFDNETYSTVLYTAEAIRILEHHNPDQGPFFIYAAYQALHGPLEAPQEYLNRCDNVIEADRHIYCGMAQALDDGIGRITSLLDAKGFADNTIIALTADNGGQNGVGGNNWPLRGNKATVFEGGVRGNGFIWGGPATRLAAQGKMGRLSPALMHNVDWGPTFVAAAGGNASAVIAAHVLDGINVWETLVATTTTTPPSNGQVIDYGPRQDVLLHLQGPDNGYVQEGWELTAALRMGDWKIVANQKEASCPPSINISGQTCLKEATGWVQLHQDGTGHWSTRSYVKPEGTQVCNESVCLFNLITDPLEQRNTAEENPDVVARLLARINEYNATRIPNQKQPFDLRSCPLNFPTGYWTPWLNSTPPLPGPRPPGPRAFNSSVGSLQIMEKNASAQLEGWCCDPLVAHTGEPNGTDPSTVRFSVGPRNTGPFSVIGTAVANHPRARLMQLGLCPNLNHGFDFSFSLKQFTPKQAYSMKVVAERPDGSTILLNKGEICFRGDGSSC